MTTPLSRYRSSPRKPVAALSAITLIGAAVLALGFADDPGLQRSGRFALPDCLLAKRLQSVGVGFQRVRPDRVKVSLMVHAVRAEAGEAVSASLREVARITQMLTVGVLNSTSHVLSVTEVLEPPLVNIVRSTAYEAGFSLSRPEFNDADETMAFEAVVGIEFETESSTSAADALSLLFIYPARTSPIRNHHSAETHSSPRPSSPLPNLQSTAPTFDVPSNVIDSASKLPYLEVRSVEVGISEEEKSRLHVVLMQAALDDSRNRALIALDQPSGTSDGDPPEDEAVTIYPTRIKVSEVVIKNGQGFPVGASGSLDDISVYLHALGEGKRVLAKVTAEVEYAVVPKAVPKSGSRSQIEPSPGSLPKVSVTVTRSNATRPNRDSASITFRVDTGDQRLIPALKVHNLTLHRVTSAISTYLKPLKPAESKPPRKKGFFGRRVRSKKEERGRRERAEHIIMEAYLEQILPPSDDGRPWTPQSRPHGHHMSIPESPVALRNRGEGFLVTSSVSVTARLRRGQIAGLLGVAFRAGATGLLGFTWDDGSRGSDESIRNLSRIVIMEAYHLARTAAETSVPALRNLTTTEETFQSRNSRRNKKSRSRSRTSRLAGDTTPLFVLQDLRILPVDPTKKISVSLEAGFGWESRETFDWYQAAVDALAQAGEAIHQLGETATWAASRSYFHAKSTLDAIYECLAISSHENSTKAFPFPNRTDQYNPSLYLHGAREYMLAAKDKISLMLHPRVKILGERFEEAKEAGRRIANTSMATVFNKTSEYTSRCTTCILPYASRASDIALDAARRAVSAGANLTARGTRAIAGEVAEQSIIAACDMTSKTLGKVARKAKKKFRLVRALWKRTGLCFKLVANTVFFAGKTGWRATYGLGTLFGGTWKTTRWILGGAREVWRRSGDATQARKDFDFLLWLLGMGYKD
ncbi:hypothetical protein AAMO2058_001597300 [Amorphochlora amoebiformis]